MSRPHRRARSLPDRPAPDPAAAAPFWEKPIDRLTPDEWEALCDGCGKCCLTKLEYEDGGEIDFTDIACRLLDHHTCRCRDYPGRKAVVPDCIRLTPETIGQLDFMPPTCAYRLRAAGKPLPWWHYLISGDRETVHRVGQSARDRVVCETEVSDDELVDHVVDWPARLP